VYEALQYAIRPEKRCELKISWLNDYRIAGCNRYIREMQSPISERKLVFLLGCAQFINTLDFAMVLPLGPDFAKALGIPVSKLGMVGGSYIAAEVVAGIAGAFFLDRFDRRRALTVALTGLVAGTAACGLATGFVSLLAARMVAGLFGGTAETLTFAILSDVVAPERRGRAMGAIQSSLAVASVLGVPAGLELARLGGWRAPFFTLAALGTVITAAAMSMLPPQRGHLSGQPAPFREMLSRPVVWLAITGAAIGSMAHYMLVPNLSAYVQFNRGYPRDRLGLIYMIGGGVVFGTVRLAGWLADRYGAAPVTMFGTALYAVVLICGFIYPMDAVPVLVVFVGFMISSSFRFVPMQALLSRIPGPHERARFMSTQSVVECGAQATGAMLGAQILTEHPDGSLAGIDDVAWLAIAMTFVYVALGYAIERRVRVCVAGSGHHTSTE
jgi:predicted MFS family arabinose efflux permease